VQSSSLRFYEGYISYLCNIFKLVASKWLVNSVGF
jgi:hypothetical protein